MIIVVRARDRSPRKSRARGLRRARAAASSAQGLAPGADPTSVRLHHRWFAGALALAWASTPGAVAAQHGPSAHLEGAPAGAEIRAGARFAPIAPDAELPARFELRTAAEGVRLVLADGTRVDLAPRSRLSRLAPVDVALVGAGKVSAGHLSLVSGEVFVEVPPTARAGATLISSRDVLLAALPGTALRARARAPRGGPAGAPPIVLALAVYEGEARFLTQGAWKPLRAGQVVEAIGNVQAPAPGLLPAGPSWSPARGACSPGSATRAPGDCSIALALAADAAPLTLGWADTPRAVGYRLEIAADPEFHEIVAARDTAARSATLPLAVGRYFARVRAQGVEQLLGLPGATRELRVARVDLPAGTGAVAGAWLLPRERQVALGDPAGLELALGRTGFWKAPARFGLTTDEPLQAALRVAGAPDFLPLVLQPAPLRAAVRVSPRNPVWPHDTITITVRLDDRAGPVPAGFEPTLRVQINAADAPVAWSRAGDVWEGSLRPAASPGPWLVHAEARDPHDNLLGEAFVEVSGPPPRLAARP
jgi:hypothetical protein